jgi:hypothetical protein
MLGDVMTHEERKCLRCESPLAPGYLVDRGREPASVWIRTQVSWVEGPPQQNTLQSLVIGDRDVFPVLAGRCRTCGTIDLRAG